MKRILPSLSIAMGALALAGCGGGGPEAGDFAAACNASGNLEAELCACLDEQATELSPETHAFVIASVAEDEQRARELAVDLSPDQQLEAGLFISRGIQECIIEIPES